MRKTILILTLLFALAAAPAFATPGNGKSNDHANSNAKMNRQVQGLEVSPTDADVSPTQITPTKVPCGPDEEYKNHGAYVSCVAKTKPGGQTVSAAAKSDIGKKKVPSGTPPPSISPSISPTITITPTATPSVSPTIEPTPDATETAETTNSEENTNLGQQIQSLIDKLSELIEMLKNLGTN